MGADRSPALKRQGVLPSRSQSGDSHVLYVNARKNASRTGAPRAPRQRTAIRPESGVKVHKLPRSGILARLNQIRIRPFTPTPPDGFRALPAGVRGLGPPLRADLQAPRPASPQPAVCGGGIRLRVDVAIAPVVADDHTVWYHYGSHHKRTLARKPRVEHARKHGSNLSVTTG